MNAIMNKTNTGKLLVAVLAMFMIVAGVAIIFSDSTQATVSGQDGTYTIDDGADLNTILTDSQGTYADVTKIVANNDITLTADADLGDITLEMKNYALYTNGFEITGGKITGTPTGTANSGFMVGIGAGSSGESKVSGTDFVLVANSNKNIPAAAIIVFNDVAATIENCTFSVEGDTDYTNFGAIQVNNWMANSDDKTTTIVGCTFGNGIITYQQQPSSANAPMTISNCGDIILNFTSSITLDGKNVVIGNGTKVVQTILGWTASTSNQEKYGESVKVTVDDDYDLGKITKGEAAPEDAKMDVEEGENGNLTTSGSEGVTIDIDKTDKTGIDQNIIALQDPVTITGDAFLAGPVTIPADRTLIITTTGTLAMNGFNLKVEGTLVIQGRGSISGTSGSEYIELMRGGIIDNEGTIGAGTPVTIKAGSSASGITYTGAGEVELLNVTGASFSLVRGDGTSTLAVSGSISKANGTTTNDTKYIDFTDGTIINAAMTTTKDVTVSGTVDIARNGSLVTAGPLSATVTLQNGSLITVNGVFTGIIKAEVKDGISAEDINDYDFESNSAVVTLIDNTSGNGKANAAGYTFEVSRTQTSDENGNVTFDQRAYLSGNIASTVNKTDVDFVISANVFIGSNVTVTASSDVTIKTEGGCLIVSGTVQNVDDTVEYVGAYYAITPENSIEAVGYISGFDKAIAQIADVDSQTITLAGNATYGVEITGAVTINDGQYVISDDSKFVTVAESATVTVNSGAEFDGDMIKKIDGKVVVMDGGYCTPAADVYDVKSTDSDNNVTYAGLAVILSEAQPGDVITVTGPNATATNITVPNSVKLVIEGTLTVDRTVTVAEGGELVVAEGGILKIGTAAEKNIPGTLTVAGTADVSEGTLTMVGGSEDSKANISSTGTFVYPTTPAFGSNYTLNGAYYQNLDGMNVLTSVAKAVAAAAEDEITAVKTTGTVSETGTIVLGGITLTLDAGSKVTLGTVDVSESKIDSSDGELTATITGKYGVEGATSEAAVQLNKAKVDSITNNYSVNAQNETIWTFNLGEFTGGDVTVSQGTVTAGKDMSGGDGDKNTLTVAEGATLAVNSTVDIKTYEEFNVNGTLQVGEKGTLGITVEKFNVAGTMTVDGQAAVVNAVITGTLTVTDNEDITGTLTVNNCLSVGNDEGAIGTVEGTVGFATTPSAGYALAYPGSTVSIDNFGGEDKAIYTEFYINGALYVTAYTATGSLVTAIGSTGFMADVEITGFVTETTEDGNTVSIINDVKNWFSDETLETALVSSGTSTFNIGGKNAAYIELDPATAAVQYSVGTGISLYVDGVKVTSGYIGNLSVGTHQVTATVDPGYKGDVAISFDGQAVSGTFTVTPEMAGTTVVLSATGNITQDSTVVIDGGESGDSGMGLTDYLLIILVILIVVMAIMVAMRLMRS